MIGTGARARSTLIHASLACFAVLTLVPLGASAQSACRVLDPELVGIYQGGCKDGLAEGYGEVKGVARSQGEVKGAGETKGQDEARSTGYAKGSGDANSSGEGKGSGEARGAADYRGEFRAGRKHGKGVKTWATGDRYEGDFVEDRKEGTGKYTWSPRGPAAGESYSGAYLNDRRHGHGVYTWLSGDRYAGPWEMDAPTGPPTRMMIARARAKTETLAALGRPGVKVCRALQVGIAVRDWIRGEVTGADADRIAVRIDDPGRLPHTVGEVGWSPGSAGDVPLVKGLAFWSEAAEWKPCL